MNKDKWCLTVAKARYGRLGHLVFIVVPEHTPIRDYGPEGEDPGVVLLGKSDDF